MGVEDFIGSLSLDAGDSSFSASTPSKKSQVNDDDVILSKTSGLSLEDEDDDGDKRMKEPTMASRILAKKLQYQHPHTPVRSSPLKMSVNSAHSPTSQDHEIISDDEMNVDDSDIMMTEADTSHSFSQSFAHTAHNIFSPTELGARIATTTKSPFKSNLKNRLQETADESFNDSNTSSVDHGDDENSDFSLRNRNQKQQQQPSQLGLVRFSSNTNNDTTEDSTQDLDSTFDDDITNQDSSRDNFMTPAVNGTLSTPWGKTPIQLQTHHHHYYPTNTSSAFSTPSGSTTGGQYTPYKDIVPLPAPWSKFAEPKAPTPYIISSYLQLLFNVVTSSIAIYILINAIKTVKSDINLKMEEYAAEIAMEVSRCTRSYIENKCAPETRVSALEVLCTEWERCMNRDPTTQAGKASVSAETLGLILNSLIEPIGAKAIIVFGVGLIAWAFTSNFVFGFVRAKSYYGWDSNIDPYQQQQLQWNQPQQGYPSTPGRMLPLGPPPSGQQFTPGAPQNWDYNYTPSR